MFTSSCMTGLQCWNWLILSPLHQWRTGRFCGLYNHEALNLHLSVHWTGSLMSAIALSLSTFHKSASYLLTLLTATIDLTLRHWSMEQSLIFTFADGMWGCCLAHCSSLTHVCISSVLSSQVWPVISLVMRICSGRLSWCEDSVSWSCDRLNSTWTKRIAYLTSRSGQSLAARAFIYLRQKKQREVSDWLSLCALYFDEHFSDKLGTLSLKWWHNDQNLVLQNDLMPCKSVKVARASGCLPSARPSCGPFKPPCMVRWRGSWWGSAWCSADPADITCQFVSCMIGLSRKLWWLTDCLSRHPMWVQNPNNTKGYTNCFHAANEQITLQKST